MKHTMRRVSFVFLSLLPFLVIPLTAVRALRVPGVYQSIGGLLFIAIGVAGWVVGAGAIRTGTDATQRQQTALAGALLLVPFTLVALLWVGLAPPWEATPTENRMRYLVLLTDAIAVTGGFVILKGVLDETGERLYSALGFAANMLAGAAYLVWLSFVLGAYVVKVRTGQTPAAVVAMGDVYEILLLVACVLTYLTTAAFAASLGRARWLNPAATRIYVIANVIALLFILTRGLSFPDPTTSATPWYVQPGFIAGIPAVPWIMPFLLGVVVLRRAGDEPVS